MAFVRLRGLPVVKISAQSDVVYWSYCPNPPPPSSSPKKKCAQIGPEPKKMLFLLGKVENNKYSEAKIWHPESIDGWSYYTLCENF